MYRILMNSGGIGLICAAKILVGCCFGLILQVVLKRFGQRIEVMNPNILLLLASIAGVILPFDTWGAVPMIIVLLHMGLDINKLIPLLIANSLFNMSTPLMAEDFMWSLGVFILIMAVVVAFTAGLILRFVRLKISVSGLCPVLAPQELKGVNLLKYIGVNLLILTPFALVGAFVYEVVYFDAMNAFKSWFYATPFGFQFGRAVSRLSLFNNFFYLALSIVELAINPMWLLSLFALLKPKGITLIYGYLAAWSLLLCLSLFIL